MFTYGPLLLAFLSAVSAVVSLIVARRIWRNADREARIAQAERALEESRQKVGSAKGRVRAAEVDLFLARNESLLENEDLDFLVSSQLLQRSSSFLLQISNEITELNRNTEYPLEDFQALILAFNRLDKFVKKAFAFHEKKFGLPEETEAEETEAESSGQAATPLESAMSSRRQAESEVALLRNGSAT